MDWEAAYAEGNVESPLDVHLMRLAAMFDAGTALDIGCGAGQNSVWLAQQGWRVTGVDIAPSAIAAAHRAASDAGVDASFAVADTRTWTTEDQFDFVFSTYALPSRGPGRDHALATAAKAVTPGGTILITEFDVSMGDDGPWDLSDLTSVDDIRPHLTAFDIVRLDVERTRHAHGHDEMDYPIVVAIAKRAG